MGLDQEINGLFQILTPYNTVYQTVFHQEFRRLKALRQFLADGLFNNSGTRKAHQRPRGQM